MSNTIPSSRSRSRGRLRVSKCEDPLKEFRSLEDRITTAIHETSNRETSVTRKTGDVLKDPTAFSDDATPLECLVAWGDLLVAIQANDHYFEVYGSSVCQVFQALEQSSTTTVPHTYVKVLLQLLKQSVEESHRDPCLECRFVTLLEVLRSYSTSWTKPSEALEAFWARLTHRIPSKIPADSFRRKCYRILVSLSWVPSNKGLLEACSFLNSKVSLNFTSTEATRQKHRDTLGCPIPRWDQVNQILDRLKDETGVCIAITSSTPGVGKSHLVAQVASHPSIQRVFSVVWLKKCRSLTYDTYTALLKSILVQLQEPHSAILDLVASVSLVPRLEEEALRKIREDKAMELLKSHIVTYLQNRTLLLILEDTDEAVIEWFQLSSNQSTIFIVENRIHDDSVVDWSLEISDWSVEEAMELFVNEADLPKKLAMGTAEICRLVMYADCHPLTVRAMARWFRLKRVSVGVVTALQEIEDELHESTGGNVMFDVLSLMMGPHSAHGISVLFILCFSVFSVVFPNGAPLDAALLLWEEVLKLETLAIDEIRNENEDDANYVNWIGESLLYMGVIRVSFKEKEDIAWADVYHEELRQFGVVMAKRMNLQASFADTIADWNLAFVTGYFDRKSQGLAGDCWAYCLEKLPSHMLKAMMLPTAELVLTDDKFFNARLKCLGWEKSTEQYVKDCINLQVINEHRSPEYKFNLKLFEQLSRLLHSRSDKSILEACKALHRMAFSLAENGYHDEALAPLRLARQLPPPNKKLKIDVEYVYAYCLWSTNQMQAAKESVERCQSLVKDDAIEHQLFKDIANLYVDILIGACEYSAASAMLQAHISSLRADPELNPIELGVALLSYGKLCITMGNNNMAKEVLIECIEWKRKYHERSRSLSVALSLLGDIKMDASIEAEALEHYEEAIQLLSQLQFNESHLDYRLLAGKVQYLKKDFNRAQHSFELVRLTGTACPLLAMDQTAYDLRKIARMTEGMEDEAKAAYLIRESLTLTDSRPLSLERSWGLIALGNLLILQEGEEYDALQCYEQASKIQMSHLDHCGVTNDTVNLIGHALVALEDYDRAIVIFTQNLEKAKEIAADDLDRQAGILYLIADASEAKDDFSGAAWNFNQCLGILRKARTSDHPDIAQILERLAHVTSVEGDIDMALAYCQQAVQIRRKENDTSLLASVLFEIASLAIQKSDVDMAEKALIESTSTLEGTEDVELQVAHLVELGRVLVMRRKNEEAKRAFQICAELSMDDDVKHSSQLRLVHLKLSAGEYENALADYQHLEPNESLELKFAIAMTHFLLGQHEEAMKAAERLIHLKEPSNYRTLSYLLKGDILEHSGETTKATEAWSEGLNASDQTTTSIEIMLRQRLDNGHGYLYSKDNGDDCETEEKSLRHFVLWQSCHNH